MTRTHPSSSGARIGDTRGDERRTLAIAFCGGLALFLLALCAVPGIGPVLRIFTMPSSSMLPTLEARSILVVSRASYGYSRRSFDWFDLPIAGRWPDVQVPRGDVAIFRLPRDPSIFYVKRIIGLPGDEILVRGGTLQINGQPVPRVAKGNYLPAGETVPVPRFEEQLPNGVRYDVLDARKDSQYDDSGPYKVPAGYYFVLGDNRDNSVDSREMSPRYGVGFVPSELLIGRVIHTF